MNCKQCECSMEQVHNQQHFHCRDCNAFEFPTAIETAEVPIKPLGTSTAFQCPKCALPLEVGNISNGDTQVCFCNNCRGFVTPSQSLGELISELRSAYQGDEDRPVPIDPKELDTFQKCPACLERMDSHPYYGPGNVVLDTCNHCKLAWLDHGELAKIVRAPGPRPNQKRATGNFESQALRNQFNANAENARVHWW